MTDYENFMQKRRTNRKAFFLEVKDNSNFKNVSEIQALREKLESDGKVKKAGVA